MQLKLLRGEIDSGVRDPEVAHALDMLDAAKCHFNFAETPQEVDQAIYAWKMWETTVNQLLGRKEREMAHSGN